MDVTVSEAQVRHLARVAALVAVARDTASSLQLVSSQLQAELSTRDRGPDDPFLDRLATGVDRERQLTAQVQALTDQVDQLRRAMESRAVIEQAKGIVMARCGCDAHAAFAMLCAVSRTERRKVREVAVTVVSGAQEPGRPQPG